MAAQLGYCGLDRRRAPLVGDEIRACWESPPAAVTANPVRQASPPAVADAAEGRAGRREFIEIVPSPGADKPTGAASPAVPTARAVRTAAAEPAARGDGSVAPAAAPGAGAAARPGTPTDGLMPSDTVPPPMEPRWNLWGDLEI